MRRHAAGCRGGAPLDGCGALAVSLDGPLRHPPVRVGSVTVPVVRRGDDRSVRRTEVGGRARRPSCPGRASSSRTRCSVPGSTGCRTSSSASAGPPHARSSDHLPPARLLGAHRAGRAVDPRRRGLGHPAALLVQGRARPQGRQAAARRRGVAAEHPGGGRAPAPPRHPGPRRDHAVQRRHHGLRVRLARGGRRPAAGRPGRVRHRRQRGDARDQRVDQGLPGGARRRRQRSTRPPRTSCPAPPAGALSRADRLTAHQQRLTPAGSPGWSERVRR